MFRVQLELAGWWLLYSLLFSKQRLSFLSCEGRVPFMTSSQVQMLGRVCQLPNARGACTLRLLALPAGIRAYVCFAGGRNKAKILNKHINMGIWRFLFRFS